MGGSKKLSDGVQLNSETVGFFVVVLANSIPVITVFVHLSIFLKVSSEITRPIELKFYMETPLDPRTKFCSMVLV